MTVGNSSKVREHCQRGKAPLFRASLSTTPSTPPNGSAPRPPLPHKGGAFFKVSILPHITLFMHHCLLHSCILAVMLSCIHAFIAAFVASCSSCMHAFLFLSVFLSLFLVCVLFGSLYSLLFRLYAATATTISASNLVVGKMS